MTERIRNQSTAIRMVKVAICLLIGFAPLLKADVMYTYVGNEMANNELPPLRLCIWDSCAIDGLFRVQEALAGGLNLAPVVPTSYIFRVGGAAGVLFNPGLSQNNSTIGIFQISTDQSGNITEWAIRVSDKFDDDVIGTFHTSTFTGDVASEGFTESNARNSDNPGVWSMITPEPSSLFLFGTIALALTWMGRRSSRRTLR